MIYQEWRVVPSFPNYEVSERGGVRTRFKTKTRPAHRLLKPRVMYGYHRFELWVPELKKDRMIGAHALVCEAWHGPRPSENHEPAHWDGDRANNHFLNLRWATRIENAADRTRHGNTLRGDRNPGALLTDEQVGAIRSMPRGPRGWQRQLARTYGVSEGCISSILNGTARVFSPGAVDSTGTEGE